MKQRYCIDTAIGLLTLAEEEGQITDILFGKEGDEKEFIQEPTPLMEDAIRQLEEYFSGKRKTFDLPLAPRGTEFQKSVWKALEAIPYGETRSYKDIAAAIGNPKASRAVGMANNKNPISIVVP